LEALKDVFRKTNNVYSVAKDFVKRLGKSSTLKLSNLDSDLNNNENYLIVTFNKSLSRFNKLKDLMTSYSYTTDCLSLGGILRRSNLSEFISLIRKIEPEVRDIQKFHYPEDMLLKFGAQNYNKKRKKVNIDYIKEMKKAFKEAYKIYNIEI
jgi:hypothetical protein